MLSVSSITCEIVDRSRWFHDHGAEYVINHSELSLIFCSTNHVSALIETAPKCPKLKVVISFDAVNASMVDAAKEKGVQLKEFSECEWRRAICEAGLTRFVVGTVEAYGKERPLEPIPAKLDQLACICYTSGTTSNPKG
jgi:long-chain acyl-CoA synthetase